MNQYLQRHSFYRSIQQVPSCMEYCWLYESAKYQLNSNSWSFRILLRRVSKSSWVLLPWYMPDSAATSVDTKLLFVSISTDIFQSVGNAIEQFNSVFPFPSPWIPIRVGITPLCCRYITHMHKSPCFPPS